jgi:hypothetical protein
LIRERWPGSGRFGYVRLCTSPWQQTGSLAALSVSLRSVSPAN